jgi:aldose 1-epimerase
VQHITLTNGLVSVVVDPEAGGRIAQITYADTELIMSNSDTNVADNILGWGCYPMVPFAGRLRNGTFEWNGKQWLTLKNHGTHAIHGTTVARAWDVVSADNNVVQLQIALDDGTGELWPFGGVCTHTVRLKKQTDGRTELSCSLRIDGSTPGSPYQLGWHPWFVKPTASEFSFTQMYLRDGEGIAAPSRVSPTPPPWDDCFTGARINPVMHFGHVDVELQSNLSHWVIFDELSYATCVEPQSGPPDEFNFSPEEKTALGLQGLRHDGDSYTAEFTMLFNSPT